MKRLALILGALLGACSHGSNKHDDHAPPADSPSSTPIPAITYDALLVINGGDTSILVIDVAQQGVASTIALRHVAYPHHAALSADRATLLVAAPGMDLSGGHGAGHGGMQGAVLKLSATTGEAIAGRRLDAMNHNAIYATGGSEIWTTQMTTPGRVLVLDGTTLATKHTIEVGNMPAEVSLSPDGSRAFVANGGSNTVSVIDVASKAVTSTIPVGDGPVGAWPGGDGVMYVDNEHGKTITAINATSLEVLRTYDLGFTPAMAATLPTGELWVTDTQNGKVVFFAAGATTKVGEVATGAGAHALVFSPPYDRAYVTNQEAGTVSVIDVATRTVTQTIPVGTKPNGAVYRTN